MIFISVFSFQFLFFVLRFLGYIVICTSHAVACGRDAQPEHTLDRPPQVAFEENQSQVPQNGLEWQVVRGPMSENERGKKKRDRVGELSIFCVESCDAISSAVLHMQTEDGTRCRSILSLFALLLAWKTEKNLWQNKIFTLLALQFRSGFWNRFSLTISLVTYVEFP